MIYWALFLIIFFVIIIVVIIFSIGNYLLRKIVESFLQKKEGFSNMDRAYLAPDECSQIDHMGDDKLYMQCSTNIPMAPFKYADFVGEIYTHEPKNGDNLTPPPSCNNSQYNFVSLIKPKLIYDGIFDPHIKKDDGWESTEYTMNPDTIVYEKYFSNKMLEHNFKVPNQWRDLSSTPYVEGGDKVQYFFNDTQQDVMDTELYCWDQIFNAGVTNQLKNQEKMQYPKSK